MWIRGWSRALLRVLLSARRLHLLRPLLWVLALELILDDEQLSLCCLIPACAFHLVVAMGLDNLMLLLVRRNWQPDFCSAYARTDSDLLACATSATARHRPRAWRCSLWAEPLSCRPSGSRCGLRSVEALGSAPIESAAGEAIIILILLLRWWPNSKLTQSLQALV